MEIYRFSRNVLHTFHSVRKVPPLYKYRYIECRKKIKEKVKYNWSMNYHWVFSELCINKSFILLHLVLLYVSLRGSVQGALARVEKESGGGRRVSEAKKKGWRVIPQQVSSGVVLNNYQRVFYCYCFWAPLYHFLSLFIFKVHFSRIKLTQLYWIIVDCQGHLKKKISYACTLEQKKNKIVNTYYDKLNYVTLPIRTIDTSCFFAIK